ncbi:hypothetical protein GQX74_014260 [Glossina fuscipes]|nr:hypothetical protein GQX74_014260 [Glossina fuscipes]
MSGATIVFYVDHIQGMHVEAVSAYLNSTLKKTVDMQQPEMFDDGSKKGHILQKSIHRLKTEMSRVNSEVDQSVFHNESKKKRKFNMKYMEEICSVEQSPNTVKIY